MATVIAPAKTKRPDAESSPIPYRFSVKQYHRMIEAGIFASDDRCELLEGWVIRKMVHNSAHDSAVWLMQTMLLAHLTTEFVVRIQSSIETVDSRPEPDVAVVRGPGTKYFTAHPTPRDVALVVEVADATLTLDRTVKYQIYAQARIPCYWIVNPIDQQIEVYTNPRAGRSPAYRRRQDFRPGDLVPFVLGGIELTKFPVRELLP